MAIKKDDLAKMLVRLKVAPDEAAATTMITEDKEHPVALPDGIELFSKDEITTRDKSQYEKGKTAGEEMSLKGIFTKELPEYNGKKDAETLIAQLTLKVQKDGNIQVDQKVQERDKTINQLRGKVTELEQSQVNFEATQKKMQRKADLLSWTIDKKPDNLSNEQWLAVIETENELVEGDGGAIFVKRNGQIVQDGKLFTNIPAKDAVLAYITDKKLGKTEPEKGGGPSGGRGAGDSKHPTGSIRSLSQFEAYCTENKIDMKSQKATVELDRISKEVTDFDWKA